MKKPLLSICIPTWNRCDVLKLCLDSIYTNKAYCGDIEVVVSDNCSSDGTCELAQKYLSKYPDTFVYNRNECNIGGNRNFVKLLDIANGEFCKLHNDYSIFTEDGLRYLIDVVKQNRQSRETIFFDNSLNGEKVLIKNVSMDELVGREAWKMSWLGNYGYWSEDYKAIDNKMQKIETRFVQIDLFLKILDRKGVCCIATAPYSTRFQFKQKQGGYNFFQVHTENFISMYEEYYRKGEISAQAYESMLYKLFCSLLPYLTKFLITEKENFTYELDGWQRYFYKAFGRYRWFYPKMFRWELSRIRKIFKQKISC